MPDEYDDLVEHVDQWRRWFILSPAAWAGHRNPKQLKWKSKKFDKKALKAARSDLTGQGIYTFVVHPNVAAHPAAAYLFYVGMTDQQDFYTRWKQEIDSATRNTDVKQPRLRRWLRQWAGHIWAYYAELPAGSPISKIETDLQLAWWPPANDRLPGLANKARKAFE